MILMMSWHLKGANSNQIVLFVSPSIRGSLFVIVEDT